MRWLVLAAVLACSGATPAQDPAREHAQRIREVLKTFQESRSFFPGDSRTAALRALVDAGPFDGRTQLLATAFQALVNEWDRLAQRIATAEREMEDSQQVWIRTAGERREALLGQFRRNREEFEIQIRYLRAVEGELAIASGGIVSDLDGLAPAERDRRVREMASRARRAQGAGPRAFYLNLLGKVPDEGAVAFLVDEIRRGKPFGNRVLAAEALACLPAPEREAALVAALEDAEAPVRAAAVRGLRRIGGRRAAAGLIERLEKESGRLLDDVVVALAILAGQSFHDNAHLWRDWLSRQGEDWSPARRFKPPLPGDRARAGRAATFYGAQFSTEGVVYLIDISDSMNEPAAGAGTTGSGRRDETKLDHAKRELIKSIEGLPSGVNVNVIAYNDTLHHFSDGVVVLDDRTRRAITGWTRSLLASGRTNIYDALASVLAMAENHHKRPSPTFLIDTIVLLTDGLPTEGRLTDPLSISSRIQRMNQLVRCTIHTVGVGPDHSRTLLESLSEDSGGQYIRAR